MNCTDLFQLKVPWMGAGDNGRTGLLVLSPAADKRKGQENVTVLNQAAVVISVWVILLKPENV